MPRLFHVSDEGPFTVLAPRPSPAGTPYEGRPLVWAIDERHLPNYLLPRDCPRVCWAPTSASPPLLASTADRVIVIEAAWAQRARHLSLLVHELDAHGFELLDSAAGYWVSEADAPVVDVRPVEDCVAELMKLDVEVRIADYLWPYVDAVLDSDLEFSVIRARNARPRSDG